MPNKPVHLRTLPRRSRWSVEIAKNKCRRHEFKRMCKVQRWERHNAENDGNLNRQTPPTTAAVYGLSEELPRIRTSYRKKTGNQCFSKNPNDASCPRRRPQAVQCFVKMAANASEAQGFVTG